MREDLTSLGGALRAALAHQPSRTSTRAQQKSRLTGRLSCQSVQPAIAGQLLATSALLRRLTSALLRRLASALLCSALLRGLASALLCRLASFLRCHCVAP